MVQKCPHCGTDLLTKAKEDPIDESLRIYEALTQALNREPTDREFLEALREELRIKQRTI